MSRTDCRSKLRAGPDRNVEPHPSRNSEVWSVLSSAIGALMFGSCRGTEVGSC